MFRKQWAAPQLTSIIADMSSRQFSKSKFIVITIAVMSLFIGHSLPTAAKQVTSKFAAIYKEMLAAALKADQQLAIDMDTVAQTIKEFADAQGHFPDTGDDIAGLSLELSAVLPKNPYSADSAANANTQSSQPATDLMDAYEQPAKQERAQVIYDPSINATIVDRLITEPSANWKAKPGTVVAVTNGYDLCLIWGAGIDELPMREPNGRVRLTVLKSSSD